MPTTRREFLAASAVAAAGLPAPAAADKPRLKKAIKYAMIAGKGSPAEKLALAKKVGFEGVEILSPSDLDLAELKKASAETGVVIHGVIDAVHWDEPLSHPDEAVRAKGLAALKAAIADAKTVGADTCLLVPGVVDPTTVHGGSGKPRPSATGVTFQQCWDRSTAEVKKALPDAKKAGVKIAVEVVWNDFLTTPDQLIAYVDQFQSPWVGAYFDASNMLKYGVPAATWIQALGKRMLKFDFKGYSHELAKKAGNPRAGFGAGIGEGSEDWPEVLRALADVGYSGWFTAEVKAGDEAWLADVSRRMDKILGVG